MARYSYNVRDLTTGVELLVFDDECILDAFEKAGVDLPYSCRAGACSSCIALLITGQVEDDSSFLDYEQRIKFISTCSAYPQSDCVIRTGVEPLLYDEEKAQEVFFEDWQNWN